MKPGGDVILSSSIGDVILSSLLTKPFSIAQLETALDIAEEQVRTAEERMQQLRAELLLREDNYNKHFKNGGAGRSMRVLLCVGKRVKRGQMPAASSLNKSMSGSCLRYCGDSILNQ